MKSILVFNTPMSCGKCRLCYKEGDSYFSYRCIVDESQVNFKTLSESCPLKPIPEGHGDLIDRKALIENGLRKGFCDWYDEIKMADAIIESDKGETE